MKKVLSYMFCLASAMLAGCTCSGDSIAEGDILPPAEEEEVWPWGDGVSVEVPDLEMHGDQEPTRALIYNFDKKLMKFSWKNSSAADATDGDKIGVYPASSIGQQQPFVMTNDPISVTDNSVTGKFRSMDEAVLTIGENTQYVSYFPYIHGDYNYTEFPIHYLNQKQMANVNITAYAANSKSEEYRNSEPNASAHLEPYDFLVSNATSTSSANIHFVYTRLGSVVRFFIKVPESIVYDSLHLVNKDAWFTTKAKVNILTQTLTPTKQSHVMCLEFDNDAFDLTTSGTTHYNTANGKAYIIAYMMLAPVTLDLPGISNCFLYLSGHDKDTGDKKYFRSAALNRYDIEQNKTLQWTPTMNPDEPITFTAIEVEEWKDAVGYSNGDDGKGTERW